MSHRLRFIGFIGFALAFGFGANMADAKTSHYFGRWTVSDEDPKFSTKGKLYQTFDVAPCGKDFCGVSVSGANDCGPTLFRFFSIRTNDEELNGHGVWGSKKKTLKIIYGLEAGAAPNLLLGIGENDLDFTGREGSIPTFEANYKQFGKATCVAQ
jgi:hypothetical protein